MNRFPLWQIATPADQGKPSESNPEWKSHKQLISEMPLPVFDEFRQVFIVTDGAYSFYMDLEGNFAKTQMFAWSGRPLTVELVRPFLIGFLEDRIERKHLLAPNTIYDKVEHLGQRLFKPLAVARSFDVQNLDSVYMIIGNHLEKCLLKL